MAQKKGLGRGLNDLLGTSEASKPSRSRNNQQNSSENTSKEVKTVTKEVVKEVVKEVEQKIKINLIEQISHSQESSLMKRHYRNYLIPLRNMVFLSL